MNRTMLLVLAGAMALAPSAGSAKVGSAQPVDPAVNPGQGATNGAGWDHSNGPATTGQPGVECEDVRPGNAAGAPGSAFNPDGRAGTRYAGEQPQNSRNTASVSQYDIACLNQPPE